MRTPFWNFHRNQNFFCKRNPAFSFILLFCNGLQRWFDCFCNIEMICGAFSREYRSTSLVWGTWSIQIPYALPKIPRSIQPCQLLFQEYFWIWVEDKSEDNGTSVLQCATWCGLIWGWQRSIAFIFMTIILWALTPIWSLISTGLLSSPLSPCDQGTVSRENWPKIAPKWILAYGKGLGHSWKRWLCLHEPFFL